MSSDFKADKDALYFVPLGGSEQFGVNFNLYGYDDRWLAIDCGVGFADHTFPLVDLLLPDPAFAEERADRLEGLIITHAHEDHIGAVAYLWDRLRCPIYCTQFTAQVLRAKLDDQGVKGAKIHVINSGQRVKMGPFQVTFHGVAHSIPEAVACFIDTPKGMVVHSGDWNLDPDPVLGQITDPAVFKAVGEKGVLAYIGDSTNAPVPGRGKSETVVQQGLHELFAQTKGRIAITLFASNISRVHSIALAAQACERSCVLVGRSLHRMVGVAKNCGYLKDTPDFLSEDELGFVPHENSVLLVTGSQGETNAALARISRGEMRQLRLGRGDTVVFSARAIPGNEVAINAVMNNLISAGVKVVTPDTTSHTIHASGHPYHDEVSDMLDWVKPQIVVPVHGERLQLQAQADIATAKGVPHVIVPRNGAVIQLAPGEPTIVDHVPTGVLAVEPSRIVPTSHTGLAQRRKLQYTGAVLVSLVLDRRGELIAKPHVTTVGIIDPGHVNEQNLDEDLTIETEDILEDLDHKRKTDPEAVTEAVTQGLRRFVHGDFGFKPKVTVHVIYAKG
jgi:ribonuclease J